MFLFPFGFVGIGWCMVGQGCCCEKCLISLLGSMAITFAKGGNCRKDGLQLKGF